MTRLNNHLLAQRVNDRLVILDESTGEEVVIPSILIGPFVRSVMTLFPMRAEERHPQPATD